ncbi:AAA family ATPase [Tenacibaculum retecalamus]|uniref:AAA family ATPase n=1 Tax=Tenacibaculum retecalamus TaxID=3018315 RepID=UPI0023D8F285|nr:AAA family ATPase [Tenacibaculum retecalamus]WBX71960.1 AAA family ATPase [Tenacibaculum retecalamus]
MYNELIKDLKEALNLSPQNLPLKLRLGKCYEAIFDLKSAEEQYLEVLRIDNKNIKAKENLASIYYSLEKNDTALVIIEDILPETPNNIALLELQCKVLIKLSEFTEAQEVYKHILEINSKYSNEEIDSQLRENHIPFSEETDEDAIDSLDRPTINFSDIGGMEEVKNEISLKIIQPLKHPELYKAYGKKIGGGILLYGPPGCGKTHIARATAGEINANFINIGINDILDMWIGSSERNLHEIFEKARQNTPCVIFIDEIDALGANRNDVNKGGNRTVINQFLAELDGLSSNNDGILVLAATNTPWHLDPAFRRPGRFDRIIFVSPPDENARKEIFELLLEKKPKEGINFNKLSKASNDFSGADIQAAIDISIEDKLQESFKTGKLEPITMSSLSRAIKKHKPSTKEWFNSAKNYALYSNESGLYDNILSYLNIKK